jgi:hypothetical protein
MLGCNWKCLFSEEVVPDDLRQHEVGSFTAAVALFQLSILLTAAVYIHTYRARKRKSLR